MSYNAEVYKVMIASPGDVIDERNIIREVLSEWNVVNSEVRKIVLQPVGWETHSTPEMGDRAQAIINKQLKNCDLLIGVFWMRIGTPTGEYPSGSVEEIMEHIKAGKPAMLYFSSVTVDPKTIDLKQYKELSDFKQWCKSNGLCGSYTNTIDFRSDLSRQLHLKLNSEPFNKISKSYLKAEKTKEDVSPNISAEAQIINDHASITDNEIKTAILPDGRSYQLGLNRKGQLRERWKKTPNSHSGWTDWYDFPMPPGVKNLIHINDMDTLSDGRIQQWVTDSNDQIWSCWKRTPDSNSGWTPWSKDSSPSPPIRDEQDNAVEIAYKNGLASVKRGDYPEAIQAFGLAIKLKPMDAEIWFNMGNALKHLGKHNEAIKAYNEAIKIDPKNEFYRGKLKKFLEMNAKKASSRSMARSQRIV